MAAKKADIIALLESYGVQLKEVKEDEYKGTCPFCDKENHFYANRKKRTYICHKCNEKGTVKDFLGFLWKFFSENLTFSAIADLAKCRRLPEDVFLNLQLGYFQGTYYFPVILSEGDLTDLRRFQPGKKVQSSAGTITGIYEGKSLFDNDKANEPVYLCEGEFDTIVMNYLLRKLGRKGFAIGVPGANIFKTNWIPFFTNRDVIICYDHDSAGEQGKDKVIELLGEKPNSIKYLAWKDDFPQKYDISDFVTAYGFKDNKLEECWEFLESMILNADEEEQNRIVYNIEGYVGYDRLVDKYKNIFDVNEDFELMIKIAQATVLSSKIPGQDQLWMFIVGPPGYGKTAVLSSFKQATECIYQSNISRHSLCSGFKTNDGTDPSILARVNGKCLVLKDYTEVLSKSQEDRKEIGGLLRGAYDGDVKRTFGNGVVRKYNTCFSCLAGVTDEIKHYNEAQLGERFLQFEMDVSNVNYYKQQEQALFSAIIGDEGKNEIQQYVSYFLQQDFDFSRDRLVELANKKFREKIIPLARTIAWLRTSVKRHEKGVLNQNVSYRPRQESGNRLSIQFQRLGISLGILQDNLTIDDEIYALVKRVAFDSVSSFSTEIAKFLFMCYSPVSVSQIMDVLDVPRSSMYHYMEDLEILKIVNKVTETNGTKKVSKYFLNPQLKELWQKI